MDTVFVHLCCGDVVTLHPATRVGVEADLVVVYDGQTAVASYPRRDVYLCSKSETSPVLT